MPRTRCPAAGSNRRGDRSRTSEEHVSSVVGSCDRHAREEASGITRQRQVEGKRPATFPLCVRRTSFTLRPRDLLSMALARAAKSGDGW